MEMKLEMVMIKNQRSWIGMAPVGSAGHASLRSGGAIKADGAGVGTGRPTAREHSGIVGGREKRAKGNGAPKSMRNRGQGAALEPSARRTSLNVGGIRMK